MIIYWRKYMSDKKDNKFGEQIHSEFRSLTKGIRSVIILTSKGNHYYNNSFFDRNLSNESCNDFMLHETVANAIHAIKGLYSLYYKEVDWSEFKSEENWTKSTSSQNAKVASYFSEITDINRPHLLSKSNEDYFINSSDELSVAYNVFYGRMEAITNKLDELVEKEQIDNYVVLSNFDDAIGFYMSNIDKNDMDIDYINGDESSRMVGEWLNATSKTAHFSLSMLVSLLEEKLMPDNTILISDYLCQQVNTEESLDSIRSSHGLLFKFPKFGKKFCAQRLDDINNDFQFQKLADNLKMVNPRSYLMAIETRTAYYLSIPADIGNRALVTLIYMTYAKYLRTHNVSLDEGHDSLVKSQHIELPAINRKTPYEIKEFHPLLKKDRPNLLADLGRRTRRFTQAGRNLASYETYDISKQLDTNTSVFNYVITYSMRNQKEKVIFSKNIKEIFDTDDMGSLINQISYTIGGVIGSGHDDIWHNIEFIFYSISHQNIELIKKLLDK